MLVCSILGGFLNTFSLSGFYRITIGIFILSTTFFHSLLPLQEDTTQNVEPKSSYLATRIIMAQSSQEIAEIIQGSTLSKEQIFTALEPVFHCLSIETLKNLCQAAPELMHKITEHAAQKSHLFSLRIFEYLSINDREADTVFINTAQQLRITPSLLAYLLSKYLDDQRIIDCIRFQMPYFIKNDTLNDFILFYNYCLEYRPSDNLNLILFSIYLESICETNIQIDAIPTHFLLFCRLNKQAAEYLEAIIMKKLSEPLPRNLAFFITEANLKHLAIHTLPEDLRIILNTQKTQSTQHFKQNSTSILSKSFFPEKLYDIALKPVNDLIARIIRKEAEEKTNGRYIFFHAQQWHLTLYADIFKKLWEMIYREQVSDYQFLRFTPKPNIPLLEQESSTRSAMIKTGRTEEHRSRLLFMNHALFGNSGNAGSNSFAYFLTNTNVHNTEMPIGELFSIFNIETLYKKYQEKFEILEELHLNANESNGGNLLLISCTQEQVRSSIFCAEPGGKKKTVKIDGHEIDDVVTILNTLQSNPQALENSDLIEYCMALTQDLALNPQSGPRIYSFNVANTAIMNVYYELLDSIFKEIANEYWATNPKPIFAQPISLSNKIKQNISRIRHLIPSTPTIITSTIFIGYCIAIGFLKHKINKRWDNLLQENKNLKETVAAFTKVA